ncbi:hypothetical protein [Parapedobacter koreensis]|nr:hypothetical protein [Parapedobacter koreensis]
MNNSEIHQGMVAGQFRIVWSGKLVVLKGKEKGRKECFERPLTKQT